MTTFLENLPAVAGHPMAFVAYVLVIGGWVYYVFAVKRAKTILEGLKDLGDANQIKAARFLIQPDFTHIPKTQRFDAWRLKLRLVSTSDTAWSASPCYSMRKSAFPICST